MKKFFYFFTKPIGIAVIAVIIFAAAGIFYYFKNKQPLYEFTQVKRGDIEQVVSVTGKVKAAEAVDLSFEKSGKVARINVNVGSRVSAGQVLASLDNSDLMAQVSQAEASLAMQKANLDALLQGTRPEEIQIAETAVKNAEKSLADYEISLSNTKEKAEGDLNYIYSGIKDVLTDAYIKADDAINKQIDDLFTNDFSINPQLTFYTSSQSETAAEWKRYTAGLELSQFKQELDSIPSDRAGLDKALASAENHLTSIQDFLNVLSAAVNESVGLSSTAVANYKYYVNTARANVTTAITNINSKEQAIANQKLTNQNNITTAENAVNAAKNSLATAQDQLKLKKAGPTAEQIAAQTAQVQVAQANLENAKAQLRKTIITSPINGVITKQNMKVGEIVSQNTPLISVMSDAQFEIQTNIPEADIAKVKVGHTAKVTLDAYGEKEIFEAKVVEIEPAETVIEGVATYKTTLQFLQEDNRIMPGMTANIDILTAKKESVLIIPLRAISNRDGQHLVLFDAGEKTPQEKIIEVGLKGSNGEIEIVSGLKEGDRIVSVWQE